MISLLQTSQNWYPKGQQWVSWPDQRFHLPYFSGLSSSKHLDKFSSNCQNKSLERSISNRLEGILEPISRNVRISSFRYFIVNIEHFLKYLNKPIIMIDFPEFSSSYPKVKQHYKKIHEIYPDFCTFQIKISFCYHNKKWSEHLACLSWKEIRALLPDVWNKIFEHVGKLKNFRLQQKEHLLSPQ